MANKYSQIKSTPYVPQYARPDMDMFMKATDIYRQAYDQSASLSDDIGVASMMGEAAPFENDSRLLGELQEESDAKLMQWSEDGNFEDLGGEINSYSRQFAKRYRPIQKNLQQYQAYKESLEDLGLTEQEKARRMESVTRNYKGVEYREDGKAGNFFSGRAWNKAPEEPIKYIDERLKAMELDVSFRDLKDGEIITRPDGSFAFVDTYGLYETREVERISTALNAAFQGDPLFRGYIEDETFLNLESIELNPEAEKNMKASEGYKKFKENNAALLEDMEEDEIFESYKHSAARGAVVNDWLTYGTQTGRVSRWKSIEKDWIKMGALSTAKNDNPITAGGLGLGGDSYTISAPTPQEFQEATEIEKRAKANAKSFEAKRQLHFNKQDAYYSNQENRILDYNEDEGGVITPNNEYTRIAMELAEEAGVEDLKTFSHNYNSWTEEQKSSLFRQTNRDYRFYEDNVERANYEAKHASASVQIVHGVLKDNPKYMQVINQLESVGVSDYTDKESVVALRNQLGKEAGMGTSYKADNYGYETSLAFLERLPENFNQLGPKDRENAIESAITMERTNRSKALRMQKDILESPETAEVLDVSITPTVLFGENFEDLNKSLTENFPSYKKGLTSLDGGLGYDAWLEKNGKEGKVQVASTDKTYNGYPILQVSVDKEGVISSELFYPSRNSHVSELILDRLGNTPEAVVYSANMTGVYGINEVEMKRMQEMPNNLIVDGGAAVSAEAGSGYVVILNGATHNEPATDDLVYMVRMGENEYKVMKKIGQGDGEKYVPLEGNNEGSTFANFKDYATFMYGSPDILIED